MRGGNEARLDGDAEVDRGGDLGRCERVLLVAGRGLRGQYGCACHTAFAVDGVEDAAQACGSGNDVRRNVWSGVRLQCLCEDRLTVRIVRFRPLGSREQARPYAGREVSIDAVGPVVCPLA